MYISALATNSAVLLVTTSNVNRCMFKMNILSHIFFFISLFYEGLAAPLPIIIYSFIGLAIQIRPTCPGLKLNLLPRESVYHLHLLCQPLQQQQHLVAHLLEN